MKKQDIEQDIAIWFGNACIVIVLVVLLLLSGGCSTKTEWYENGQVKSHREGFVEWSEGDNKNMPLSHLSVIGK